MITIRLQRRGRKNDPSFRLIVVDSHRAAKTGDFLEIVGTYDARVDRVELKADHIKEWIKNGATVSDTVHNILVNQKVIEGKKINVLPRKTVAQKNADLTQKDKKTEETATEAPTIESAPEAPAEAPADLPVEASAQAGEKPAA